MREESLTAGNQQGERQEEPRPRGGMSRRNFLRIAGLGAAAGATGLVLPGHAQARGHRSW